MFSSEVCEIFKNTFESTNNSLEYLQTGTNVKCYLEIADFVIISYIMVISVFLPNRWHFFFCGSEVHPLLIPFSKENMKVKKVSNLNLLDMCAMLVHVSRTL